MGLDAEQAGRVREHRMLLRFGETLALEDAQKNLRMAPAHVGVGLALARLVAEIAPAIDHLFTGAAADAELQPPAGDEVGRAGVLGHIKGVLVTHIDHRRAELDRGGLCTGGRQQREGGAKLAGKMMHPEISTVGAQRLGGNREIDGLQQGVGPGLSLRALPR